MAQAARRDACHGGCEDYENKRETLMLCITSSWEPKFESEKYLPDSICRYAKTLAACVGTLVHGCAPLADTMNSNPRFKEEMRRCGVVITSTACCTYKGLSVFIWAILT